MACLAFAACSATDSLPLLSFEIDAAGMQRIEAQLREARAVGVLFKAEDAYVPAVIRFEGRRLEGSVRLKGDLPDHFIGEVYSLRIKLKKKQHGRDEQTKRRQLADASTH